jgi:hypothetical protein
MLMYRIRYILIELVIYYDKIQNLKHELQNKFEIPNR